MSNSPVIYSENQTKIILSERVYDKTAVLSAAYDFTDKASIIVERDDNDGFIIYISSVDGNNTDLGSITKSFCNRLLDHQLRIELASKFGNMRDEIVRFAFSPVAKK